MIDPGYDITWHDPKIEMPGTDYQHPRYDYLVRYTFEDEENEDAEPRYAVCIMHNGRFYLDFHDWEDCPDTDRDKLRAQARVLHWAYICHPKDYL
mgnify:CR=1 FL=1